MAESLKLPHQIVRFLIIGLLNTAIDFIVLNILVLIFEPGGNTFLFILFKSISFIFAVINSYYFNKYWVFRSCISTKSNFITFLTISVIGFLLNVAAASIVFVMLTSAVTDHVRLVANFGAIMGTFAVLLWNFIGYKFFVFKA